MTKRVPPLRPEQPPIECSFCERMPSGELCVVNTQETACICHSCLARFTLHLSMLAEAQREAEDPLTRKH